MYKYAQLNEENIAIAISELAGPVKAHNLIPIGDEPEVFLDWRYVDGEWFPPLNEQGA